MSVALAALVAFLMAPLLARVARRTGWIDHREGQEHRKPRTAPVPPIGGAAILLAGLVGGLLGDGPSPWPALLAALALGSLDDRLRGGLTPAAKLFGQALVSALLAWWAPAVGRDPVWVFALAMVAMNAVNTWDNADGAAGGLALVALACSPLGGAVAGFLPWNLARRPAEDVPYAYLGDAGSHLIGVAIAATPGAGWVLVLPLLDLARLVWVRTRSGSRPWRGDRRHLAHRLQGTGLGPVRIAGLLTLLAAAPLAGHRFLGAPGTWIGAGLTLVGFLMALRCAPDPCPSEGTSR
jgi:UDP-GlcNAc:undecaprenyl-phosphate/decaprenyl-phosphate GlcNAc-1-phosphate transferase